MRLWSAAMLSSHGSDALSPTLQTFLLPLLESGHTCLAPSLPLCARMDTSSGTAW